MMVNIKLKSSDDVIFEVDVAIAKCFGLINHLLENLGVDEDDQEPLPLLKVNSPVLKMVLEWVVHHKDDPPLPENDDKVEKRLDDMSAWDENFFKVDQGTLFDLIMAANYLDIKGLLLITCKATALLMVGKTAKGMRDTFNIQNDFSPAEEQQIRNEIEWCGL